MKKTLLFLSASLFVSWSANSQINNSGFENWTSQGTYDEPDGWGTFNFIAGFGLPASVNKDTDANSGSYSARVETLEATFQGSTDTITGLMFLGSLDVAGMAYDQRPDALEFYYKYATPGQDFAQIVLTLTKWDDANSTQISIGEATADLASVSNFTLFNMPINYLSTEAPDTLVIMMTSSGADVPIPGSTLKIDDMSLVMPVNAVADLAIQQVVVYPNPASDYLYVKTTGTAATSIEIRDLAGRLVEQSALSGAGAKISIQQLNEGNYFYELKNGGISVSRGKFNVLH